MIGVLLGEPSESHAQSSKLGEEVCCEFSPYGVTPGLILGK
jgi:hypothetical protein